MESIGKKRQLTTFRAQEADTKIVDFPDDEPYAVEALLIYLYTLEYPIHAVPETGEFVKRGCKVDKSRISGSDISTITDNEARTEVTPLMLKSELPKEEWQGRLALFRIAHRLGIAYLARASLVFMVPDIVSALESTNVWEFINEVYGLEQEEARSLQEQVVTQIAEQGSDVVSQQQLDSVLLSHPLFGCDLVKALRKKDENRKRKLAEMQRVMDRQEKENADLKRRCKNRARKDWEYELDFEESPVQNRK